MKYAQCLQHRLLAGALALLLGLAQLSEASATENALPDQPGAQRMVALFDLFCHRQVPDLARIAGIAASGGFTEILGQDLEAYQPPVRADELRAWRFSDFGHDIVMTIARSRPDAAFREAVPAFADSTNFACSLVVPVDEDGSAAINDAMTELIGRKQDDSWDQPPLRAYVWCGSDETVYACTYFWAPLGAGGTGLLTSTMFVND